MQIPAEEHRRLKTAFAQMDEEYDLWKSHWQDLAKYYLPRRYVWLDNAKRRGPQRNENILDNTGTQAARTLASGMLSGITNPARPWFNLRLPRFADNEPIEVKRWLEETRRRMLVAMGGTNFYSTMAQVYEDLVIFGTASALIYEDFDSIFRCYMCALGEFRLGQSARRQINTFARKFEYTARQLVERFGYENCSVTVKSAYEKDIQTPFTICHMIEPIDDPRRRHRYLDVYWEQSSRIGELLSYARYYDFPGICPRWNVVSNDSYGYSPGMDALGDVIQLQHETKRKAQALDLLVRPPIVADIQLKNKPTALIPGGITYVSGTSQVRAQPVYQVVPPIGEITLDIRETQARIRETFHNDLFRMISQLETVRSATEIDARREEKLVLLGPVLERFENEALSPAISRIFGIMTRAGLIEEAPVGVEAGDEIEIEYVSVLSDAQKAVATIPLERFLNILGPVASFAPEARNIANMPELLREYAEAINVPSTAIRSRNEVEQLAARDAQMQQISQEAVIGQQLAEAGKTLSETDVGGGVNALARILGG